MNGVCNPSNPWAITLIGNVSHNHCTTPISNPIFFAKRVNTGDKINTPNRAPNKSNMLKGPIRNCLSHSIVSIQQLLHCQQKYVRRVYSLILLKYNCCVQTNTNTVDLTNFGKDYSQYHQTVSRIVDFLKKNSLEFETFEHEPVRTSEEAAQVRSGYTISQGAKALIVRIKRTNIEKKFVMLVVPGDCRFDPNKVKTLFGAKDIRFATEEEVFKITDGIIPGGVPPFGNLFDLQTVVDPSLFTNKKMIFNAGDRRFSIGMKTDDYQTLTQPQVAQIVSDDL